MDSSNSPTIEKTIYEKPELFLKQFMREDYSTIFYFNSTTTQYYEVECLFFY